MPMVGWPDGIPGNLAVSGTLDVTGTSTLTGNTGVTGTLTVTSTTTLTGNAGLGKAPTATSFASIAAGTTAKSQINLASSTAPTSPVDGDVWFDGTDIKVRVSGVTKTLAWV